MYLSLLSVAKLIAFSKQPESAASSIAIIIVGERADTTVPGRYLCL